MSEIADGQRILSNLIYEAAAHGLISEDEAEAMNEDLQDLVARLEDAYEVEVTD